MMADREAMRGRICAALDAAHCALRGVDASDTTKPQTDATLHHVAVAVSTIEKLARELGYRLSEFRGEMAPDARRTQIDGVV